MAWIRAGTVAVTNGSTTVTGTGTGFAANTRVGDAFIGPDGRQYELGNVASDTVISIIPAYQGATALGASYAIMPVQGYQKSLADQVRSWVNTYGAKMAALGTTGNYDTLPVTKGGTGGTDQATARSGLGLGSAATASITVGADDATLGRLLKVGDRGIGQYLTERRPTSALDERRNYGGFDFSYSGSATDIPAGMTAASVLTMSYSNAFSNQLMIDYNSNTMWIRSTANGPWSGYAKVYTTANTTRAADGTLKAI